MTDNEGPDLRELYGEFISENKDILEKLSRELVSLEKSPGDEEVINSLFRSAHTLKGNAGFIGLTTLSTVAHKIENVLDKLRDNELDFFPEINDVFFRAIDIASLLLEDFIAGNESDRDLTGIVSDLESLLVGPRQGAPQGQVSEAKKVTLEKEVTKETEPQDVRDTAFMRVSTLRLDKMVNLVGELAAGRSRLLQISNEIKNDDLIEIASYINNISSQLQSEVLGIRMVPVQDLFNRFYRLVRDTARSLGKEVRLDIQGEDTELDKSVIEILYDPLVHLVRNCIGHAIEEKSERVKIGKPQSGTIILNAYHEHNSIFIQIKDDGRGLNIPEIRRKAVEKGIVSADDMRGLSDDEAARYIFHTGFSTASEISSVSGRGVGMDVVKSNIEKVGGDVGLEWEERKGTTVTVRVPLTLAIVQLFLVREGNLVFGIPMPYVDETIMIYEDKVEYMKGQMVYMVRHKAVPIHRLSTLFNLEQGEVERQLTGRMNTVVLNQMGMKAGIVIDEFLGKVETVIKPLGPFIERLETPLDGISGASILGTGEIVLVLDVPTLWQGI